MERRSFVKSLLPLAALLSFGKALGSSGATDELYKGKKLMVVSPSSLNSMFRKRGFSYYLPRFKPESERDIMEDMRRFVDMSEGHLDEFGREVYGCVHGDGSYSVASFAPPSGHPKEYRIFFGKPAETIRLIGGDVFLPKSRV